MSKFLILQNELNGNDALYEAMTAQQVADELNAIDKSRNRSSMLRQEVYENIESSALSGLNATQLAQLNLALSDTIDPFGNAAQVFRNIFGTPSPTITALSAARVETVSRATVLGIPFVYASNVINARSL